MRAAKFFNLCFQVKALLMVRTPVYLKQSVTIVPLKQVEELTVGTTISWNCHDFNFIKNLAFPDRIIGKYGSFDNINLYDIFQWLALQNFMLQNITKC